MTNKWTDFQKETFYDLYKMALSGLVERYSPGPVHYVPNHYLIINEAAAIAMKSVEVLTDEDGLCNPSDIIENCKEIRRDGFPKIEE